MHVDWANALLVFAVFAVVGVVAGVVRPRLSARSLRRHLSHGEAVVSVRSVRGWHAGLGGRWRVDLAAPAPGRLRLRRAPTSGPGFVIDVVGVEAVRRPSGWEGMLLAATGDQVIRLRTPQGTLDLALPGSSLHWFRSQLARG
jgi:hypothetical protein